jgi:hypothetical protein
LIKKKPSVGRSVILIVFFTNSASKNTAQILNGLVFSIVCKDLKLLLAVSDWLLAFCFCVNHLSPCLPF